MKETGIIMSGDHPKLILDGTKTMTRRTYGLEKINDMPYLWGEARYDEEVGMWLFWQQYTGDCIHIKCPYGHIGDLLWCKQKHGIVDEVALSDADIANEFRDESLEVVNRERTSQPASGSEDTWDVPGWYICCRSQKLIKWRPSIHMPHWASRITREITGLRPERLQDISEADALAEGCISDAVVVEIEGGLDYTGLYARDRFPALWDSINGKRYPWRGNWWVWAISFAKLKS